MQSYCPGFVLNEETKELLFKNIESNKNLYFSSFLALKQKLKKETTKIVCDKFYQILTESLNENVNIYIFRI